MTPLLFMSTNISNFFSEKSDFRIHSSAILMVKMILFPTHAISDSTTEWTPGSNSTQLSGHTRMGIEIQHTVDDDMFLLYISCHLLFAPGSPLIFLS